VRCATCPREITGVAGDPIVAVEDRNSSEAIPLPSLLICQPCAGHRDDCGRPVESCRLGAMHRGWLPWPEVKRRATR
jgi:hypothetical protein